MVEVRSLAIDELRMLSIFESSYTSPEYIEVRSSGSALGRKWHLDTIRSRQAILRRLAGATVKELIELYGTPAEDLRFLAAFERDKLVGLLTWKYESWNGVVWIWDVRVEQACRRRGVGRKLLEELKWSAARMEARGIMLETQNTNLPAIRFYLAGGFELVGLNTQLYGASTNPVSEVALFFFLPLG